MDCEDLARPKSDPQIRSLEAYSRHFPANRVRIEPFVMSSRPGFVTKGPLPSKFRRVQAAAAKYRR
jgi:hypothetical protein